MLAKGCPPNGCSFARSNLKTGDSKRVNWLLYSVITVSLATAFTPEMKRINLNLAGIHYSGYTIGLDF